MKKRNIISFILFLLYLGFVAWCCFGHFDSLPNISRNIFGFPTDKVVHFLMFFPFAFLCFASFDYLAKNRWKALLLLVGVLVVGLLVAVSTEAGQSLTTYRAADTLDFKADAIALASASIIILIIILLRKTDKNKLNV